jgi:hypothetical protein
MYTQRQCIIGNDRVSGKKGKCEFLGFIKLRRFTFYRVRISAKLHNTYDYTTYGILLTTQLSLFVQYGSKFSLGGADRARETTAVGSFISFP